MYWFRVINNNVDTEKIIIKMRSGPLKTFSNNMKTKIIGINLYAITSNNRKQQTVG